MIHPTFQEATEEQPYYIQHSKQGFAARQLFKRGEPTHHIAYFLVLQEAKEYVKWKNLKHRNACKRKIARREESGIEQMDEIPHELITRKDAAKILGCSYSNISSNNIRRFARLSKKYVCHNGRQIVLLRRAEVEALAYVDIPDGYITTDKAAEILNLQQDSNSGKIAALLRLNLKRKWHISSHSRWIWEKDEVEAKRKELNEPKEKV